MGMAEIKKANDYLKYLIRILLNILKKYPSKIILKILIFLSKKCNFRTSLSLRKLLNVYNPTNKILIFPGTITFTKISNKVKPIRVYALKFTSNAKKEIL